MTKLQTSANNPMSRQSPTVPCLCGQTRWQFCQVVSVRHAGRVASGEIWRCSCGAQEFFGESNYDVLNPPAPTGTPFKGTG